MRPDYGLCSPHTCAASEISKNKATHSYLDACSVFMVKGWSRSVVAMTLLYAAWDYEEFRTAGK